MKKIIFIKTIQLLVIDGIMLAFLTFKKGGLLGTGFWFIAVGSFSFILCYWPIFQTNFVTTLVNSIPRLDRDSGVLLYKFSYGIAWLVSLSDIPLFLQGTLLILGHLIPSYRICQSLKRDFPQAYQEPISFWSILWSMRKTKPTGLGLSYLFLVSRIMVTGPLLTSSTCISAPKIPVWTGTSCANFWLKAS